MAMTADEAAAVAASALTTRNVAGVAATYKTWLNGKTTLATAVVALLQAHRTSKNPTRVIAKANELYSSEEHDPPTITSITPATGAHGSTTPIVIVGTNLLGTTGVVVGGAAATAVVVNDDHTVHCTAPVHGSAATVDLTLTTPDGSVTATNGFVYS